MLLSRELVLGSPPGSELNPRGLTTFNDQVYFSGVNPVGRSVVWASDGTPAGTVDLAGYDSGTYWHYGGPVVAGGKIFFHGNVGSGAAVWASDGTPGGTVRLSVKDGGWNNNTETNTWGTALGDRLVFLGDVAPSNPTRAELFITDGTDANTHNLTAGLGGAHHAAHTVLGSHNGLAYFTDVTTQGLYRLGVTDGTAAGTRVVGDLNTGAGLQRPEYFTPAGDQVFFQVDTGQGLKLWKSDGTAAGTGPVDTTLVAVPGGMAELGGELYFLGAPATRGVAQLYRTDGTRDGTKLVAGIDYNTLYNARSNLTRAGDYLWFDNLHNVYRNDGRGGIWRSDGTASGTVQLVPDRVAGEFFPSGDRLWLGGVQQVVDLRNPHEVRATGFAPVAFNPTYEGRFTMTEMGGHVYFRHARAVYREQLPARFLANVRVEFFDDADGDGTRDPGEGPFTGSAVEAFLDLNEDGHRVGTEPAAAARNGSAVIVGAQDGRSVVRVQGTGMRFTTPQAVTVTVTDRQDPPTVQFGMNRNTRVRGTVFDDRNASGWFDAGDAPLQNRRLFLDADNDGAFDEGELSALTDAEGLYRFEHLPSGTLRVERPQGWRATHGGEAVTHTAFAGAGDTGYNFGQTTLPVPGQVRAQVFVDYDADGSRGPLDPLPQVPVRVFLDADGDGAHDAGEYAAAAPGGRVEMPNVQPGRYELVVVGMPGWVQSGSPPVVRVESDQVAQAGQVGMKPSDAPASISGTLFEDDDFDGIRDAGEPALAGGPRMAGLTVFLDLNQDNYRGADEPVTMADFGGVYRFPGLPDNTYHVALSEQLPDLLPVVPRNPPARTVAFGDATPAAADFGVAFQHRAARLTGRVYHDLNGNAAFDDGDVPVPNVKVLAPAGGSPGGSALTGPDGVYMLPVRPGQHDLSVPPQAGWRPGGPLRVNAPEYQTTAGNDIRLQPSEGGGAAPAGITGTVFDDADADGAWDAAEGRPGQEALRAFLDLDGDAFRDANEPVAPVDDRGDFAFGGLAAGTYNVRLDVSGGLAQTAPPSAPHVVTLAAGGRSPPLAFGLAYLPATVSGVVYLDANGNGVRDDGEGPAANVPVTADVDRDGVFGGSFDRSGHTNAAGEFTIAQLSPGRYDVAIRDNVVFAQTEPAANGPRTVSVGPGGNAAGLVFGAAKVAGDLSGTLFYDDNRSGTFDAGDPAYMAGWTVRVASTTEPAKTWTARTDSSGRWSLAAIPNGTYRVGLDLASASFEFTAPATPPHQHVVEIAGGRNRGGIDFGIHTKPFSFTGDVFDDADGDGSWEKLAGESGRPGVTVYVDANDNRTPDAGEPTAVTDAKGRFSFTGIELPITRYLFRAVRPPRSLLTFPYGHNDYLTAPSPTPGAITHVGQMGFHSPASHYISGTVFHDADGNGRRDDGEAPIEGRTVVFDVDQNGTVDTSDRFAVTDADGWYAFTRFDRRAHYRLREILPQDWVGTLPPNNGWHVVTGGEASETYTGVDFGSRPWARVAARHVLHAAPAPAAQQVAAAAAAAAPIARDKQALLPGAAAGFDNVTTDSGGISGVVVDVLHLPAGAVPTADDFTFSVGSPTRGWAAAPAPSAITVARDGGAAGSARLSVTWSGGAIRNTWLRVVVKPTMRTGLRTDDVFYFGNLVGDTGGVGTPRVDARDLATTRAAVGKATAAALNTYDFNRDGRVNALDVILVRNNQRRALPLFTAPLAAAAAPAAAGETVVGPPSRRPVTPPRRDALLREPPRDLLA